MPQAIATITFDAADAAEVQTILASWTLTPDCRVTSQIVEVASGSTDENGAIVPTPPDGVPLDVADDGKDVTDE
jgi:hypothetical protein